MSKYVAGWLPYSSLPIMVKDEEVPMLFSARCLSAPFVLSLLLAGCANTMDSAWARKTDCFRTSKAPTTCGTAEEHGRFLAEGRRRREVSATLEQQRHDQAVRAQIYLESLGEAPISTVPPNGNTQQYPPLDRNPLPGSPH